MELRVGTSVLSGGQRYRVARIDKAYNPNQPREPAGTDEGGQWVSEGGGRQDGGRVLSAVQGYHPPWQDDDHELDNEYNAKLTQDWAQQRMDTYLGLKHSDHDIDSSISVQRSEDVLRVFKALSVDEAAHIVTYTTSSFWDLNKALRAGRVPGPLKKHAEILERAIGKLPKFEGRVMRGADLSSSTIKAYAKNIGGTIIEKGFLSTTSDGRQKFAGSTKFTIKSKTGRDVGMLSQALRQREVMFAPKTAFKIIKVESASGRYRHHITLEEV